MLFVFLNCFQCLARNHATKTTTQNLINYPKVKLLSNGKILYLLISIYMHGETLFSRTIVHGARAKKHSKFVFYIGVFQNLIAIQFLVYVYDNVRDELESLGLCSRALGGGIMDFDPQARTMTIQGKCEVSVLINVYIHICICITSY